jgi:hypothetical protein
LRADEPRNAVGVEIVEYLRGIPRSHSLLLLFILNHFRRYLWGFHEIFISLSSTKLDWNRTNSKTYFPRQLTGFKNHPVSIPTHLHIAVAKALLRLSLLIQFNFTWKFLDIQCGTQKASFPSFKISNVVTKQKQVVCSGESWSIGKIHFNYAKIQRRWKSNINWSMNSFPRTRRFYITSA